MWSSERVLKALTLAGEAHARQTIPGLGRPYLEHIMGVVMEALRAALTDSNLDYELLICCGLLHDVVEDTPVSIAAIEEQFGSRIAMGVSALTKNEALPEAQQMPDSLNRILALQQPEINILKMADRCNNLRQPPPHWNAEKIKAYHQEAVYILETLRGVNQSIENRLAELIDNYCRYWQ
jgi:(p)ppGpp synthase/HD superfamily hydrolase